MNISGEPGEEKVNKKYLKYDTSGIPKNREKI